LHEDCAIEVCRAGQSVLSSLSSIENNLPEKQTILRFVLRGAELTVRGGMLALGTLREAAVVAIFVEERNIVERQRTAINLYSREGK
jgi:hypothetical protein